MSEVRITTDDEGNVSLKPGMICHCSDEGRAAADALVARVCERLGCEPDRLVSGVIYSLHWDYSTEVVGIPCDMWSAVNVESWSDDVPKVRVWAECDSIEHGFARAWEVVADLHELGKAPA